MEFSAEQIAAMFGGFIPPAEHPFPEHIENARTIAADGMVLLKNENHTLPVKAQKVALFGAGAVDTIACGTGSGYVTAPMVNVQQGLENAGFTITSTAWIDRFSAESKRVNDADTTLSQLDRFFSGMKILIDEVEVTDEDLQSASEAKLAVYVIRRNAGENGDRDAVKGDYYLSDMEAANLAKVAGFFEKTVVVLNTTVIDANFLYEIPGIGAAVLMSLAGMQGGNALGLCGCDGRLIIADKLDRDDGEDYGYVGEIKKVTTKPILDALKDGYVPIISTVGIGEDGQSYNINADTAASRIASCLRAEKLILMTDIVGLLKDKDDDSTLIPQVNVSEVPFLKKSGIISGGMIPKIDCCVEAVRRGVKRTSIIDGRVPHSILIELLTNEGIGTQFN